MALRECGIFRDRSRLVSICDFVIKCAVLMCIINTPRLPPARHSIAVVVCDDTQFFLAMCIVWQFVWVTATGVWIYICVLCVCLCVFGQHKIIIAVAWSFRCEFILEKLMVWYEERGSGAATVEGVLFWRQLSVSGFAICFSNSRDITRVIRAPIHSYVYPMIRFKY